MITIFRNSHKNLYNHDEVLIPSVNRSGETYKVFNLIHEISVFIADCAFHNNYRRNQWQDWQYYEKIPI